MPVLMDTSKVATGTLPSDRSHWWADQVGSGGAPTQVHLPWSLTNFTLLSSSSSSSTNGGSSISMGEIRRPVLIQAPEDAYIVRNRPAKLTCRAIYADRISFKCDGEWIRQEEHEIRQGVEAVSELPYLEAVVNIHKPDVGSHGIGCECYAYTTSNGGASSGTATNSAANGNSNGGGNFGVKSDRATVRIGTLSKHFLQEPTSERQPVSSMVQLRCTPPDGEPKPEVYWLKDQKEIEARADPNVIIAHDGSLIIAAARVTDSGMYVCGARNVANHRLSHPANVTIFVNGQWSEWSSWNGECPEDCEEQSRLLLPYPKLRRHRKCNQPTPANGGHPCDGAGDQEMDCELPCPLNGQWSAWTEWGHCQPTSPSTSSKNLDNNNDEDDSLGLDDEEGGEDGEEAEDYGHPKQPKKNKKEKSASSTTTRKENALPCRKKRTRMCDNPAPRNQGLSCQGSPVEFKNCTINEPCRGVGARLGSSSLVNSNSAKHGLGTSTSSSTSTELNLAMYTGLGAAAVVFLLVFFLLLALLMRRRASACHRCGISNHYKEYETVSVPGGGGGGAHRCNGHGGGKAQSSMLMQNGNGKVATVLANGKGATRSGSGGGIGCGLPPDLTRNAPLLIYDSAHPPSSLKSDQSRMGLLTSGGWSAQHSDSSGDRSHCTMTDDNYATVDDPFVMEPCLPSYGPPSTQRNSILSALIPSNVPATWATMGAEGGCLQLPEYGVSLLVPPGAIAHDRTAEVFLAVLPDVAPRLGGSPPGSSSPREHKSVLSPVVWCGPSELALRKPVVLTFDHCAHLLPSTSSNGGWRVAVYESEQKMDEAQDREYRELTPAQFASSASENWRPAAMMGRETLNTTVYIQLDPDCAHLLTDTLSRFVLVGEYDTPAPNCAMPQPTLVTKRCRLLAFVSPSDCSVRIYCVDDTKTAVRRALNAEKESGAGGRLACEPQLFQLQPGADLCLCMEEVTPAWRRRTGANYQEIPAAHLWAPSTPAPLHCSFALETSCANDRSLERGGGVGGGDQRMWIQARVIVYQKGDVSGSRCVLSIDTTADWPTYVYGLERRMLALKLSPELRLQIGQLLDQPNERENDWRMFARQLAIDHYIPYFAARPSPTELILLLWETRERGPRAAVQLMQLFYAMQRPDAAELVALYLEEA